MLSKGEGGGVLDIMHDRSRICDHRPSHPYNAGTDHVRFSTTRQALHAPSAKRNVRCWASRKKSVLHPIQKRLLRQIILHMDEDRARRGGGGGGRRRSAMGLQ